jgi:hypothetical protein
LKGNQRVNHKAWGLLQKGEMPAIYMYSECMAVLEGECLSRTNEVGEVSEVCEVDEVYEPSVDSWTREVYEVDEVREVYEV